MVAGIAKTITWLIRTLQFLFAIILVGIISYMIHEYREFRDFRQHLGVKDPGFKPPRELIVPEVFSVLAILFTAFSIMAVCFLGYTLQLLAAFLDFVLWVGYLTSASLLRHNYHVRSSRNPLRNTITDMRAERGMNRHEHRIGGLVRLLVALVLIQLFLFTFTTFLSMWVAKRDRDQRVVHEKPRRSDAHTQIV
ncbi:uncharacterized protein H6S33_003511 [Morchella sextelata]|uniref:uncharacterized protein n=1 Tax=Morchella sextelata TaxID=1174677 RepID=UPI001D0506DD|nr:uncharacterized protein H6S33_003511 [Morchella sextelata]KAH0606677.1 hypothetical protein H6S33_003511 [Morchella sextelata]